MALRPNLLLTVYMNTLYIYTIYTTDQVDAAFVWSGNDKIYFFKGAKYWRFDPEARPPVEQGYPRPLSNWDGIPG